MKTISMSLILIAVYVVAENLNHLTMNTVWVCPWNCDCQYIAANPLSVADGYYHECQGI